MTRLSLRTDRPPVEKPAAIALVQPLPSLSFPDSAGYSEFPSLGFAVLAQALRANGHTVTIYYLGSFGQLREILSSAEVVVLGDLRYYAYFCNPAPLVRDVLSSMAQVGWPGQVIVTGRHADFLRPCVPDDLGRDLHITFETDFSRLGLFLGLPGNVASRLGHDPLPAPDAVTGDDLIVPNALSRSRPVQRVGQLMFTAGCRYACRFCEKARTPIVNLTALALKSSLASFRNAGAAGVIFWDEVFGQDDDSRDELLSQLSRSGLWFNCNTRLDMITEKFARDLSRSGCRQVLFGIELDPSESGARRTLGVDLGKGRTAGEIIRKVDLLAECGIQAIASMIVGTPDDTEESAADRVSRVRAYGFSHVYVRPLVPFPESSLYRTLLATSRIAAFESWMDDPRNRGFPHGYPTLGSMGRASLQAICGR